MRHSKTLSFLLFICLNSIVLNNVNGQFKVDLQSSYFIEIPLDTTVKVGEEVISNIGGISGIDYDKNNDKYFLVSDSGKKNGVGRYYSAKIDFDNEIKFYFLSEHLFSNEEIRGEGIRVIPNGFLVTDERTINEEERTFFLKINKDQSVEKIKVPKKFKGAVSDNSGFEGLAYSSGTNEAFIALERALPNHKDGYEVSILKYDLDNLKKKPEEYYYPLQRQILVAWCSRPNDKPRSVLGSCRCRKKFIEYRLRCITK